MEVNKKIDFGNSLLNEFLDYEQVLSNIQTEKKKNSADANSINREEL